jgi:hypothetical protein
VPERLREVAVIREEKCARGVEIEASNRNDTQPYFAQNITDRRPPLGIRECRHHLPRLVKNPVAVLLGGDLLTIYLDLGSSVGFCSEFCNDLSVNAYATARDEFFGLAA